MDDYLATLEHKQLIVKKMIKMPPPKPEEVINVIIYFSDGYAAASIMNRTMLQECCDSGFGR